MNNSLEEKSLKSKAVSKMVKASFCMLSGVAMALSSCGNPASLSGNVTGVESDTLLVFASHMNARKTFRTDTVALVNNQFELQYPDSALYLSVIAKPKGPNGAIRMAGSPILFFPGDKLKVEGNVDDLKVTGSELYDGLAKYDEIARMQREVSDLNAAYSKAYKAKDEAEKERIKKEVKACYDRLLAAKFEVVKADPNSMVAAYFASQLKPNEGLEALGLLSERVKNGPMSVLIEKAQKSFETSLVREKAKANMQLGKTAPDFKFTTIDGKDVTLASFHGKYLLVDFWGTWCGWCIKGIPDMKKAYEKHKKNVEFLGVCCGDTDKKWREGVAHHQLPWVNVLEGESGLSARYAVGGYPTKVLLDKEGKIVETFVGESPALYKKLDELFGK